VSARCSARWFNSGRPRWTAWAWCCCPHGPALYLGAHARSIEGLDEAQSRLLIDRLMALATAACLHLRTQVAAA
jgi:hypothetical protein